MKARGFIYIPRECLTSEHVVAFQVSGDCMTGDGIHDGDYIIVDPDQPVAHGDIAAFTVKTQNGTGMVVKRLDRSQGIRLVPSNPAYQAITITDESDLHVVGKVVLTCRPHESPAGMCRALHHGASAQDPAVPAVRAGDAR
jgi:SOS-response transcriptional repressor LexA